MKRDLSNVTEDHVWSLKKWVESEDKDYCPFLGNGLICWDDICYQVFPKLIKIKMGACPCTKSGVKYVVKVARQIIKELS